MANSCAAPSSITATTARRAARCARSGPAQRAVSHRDGTISATRPSPVSQSTLFSRNAPYRSHSPNDVAANRPRSAAHSAGSLVRRRIERTYGGLPITASTFGTRARPKSASATRTVAPGVAARAARATRGSRSTPNRAAAGSTARAARKNAPSPHAGSSSRGRAGRSGAISRITASASPGGVNTWPRARRSAWVAAPRPIPGGNGSSSLARSASSTGESMTGR